LEPKDYIYAIGIVVTLGLGIWNFIQAHRATRKASFINTVTAQRVLWIEQMRQDVSMFVGLTHTWAMSDLEDKPSGHEVLKDIDRLRHVIRLRLNPDDPPDKKIAALVKKVPELTHESKRSELLTTLEELTTATQDMLKTEWEKVKAESKDGDLKETKRGGA
jgi:hypothetical protein